MRYVQKILLVLLILCSNLIFSQSEKEIDIIKFDSVFIKATELIKTIPDDAIALFREGIIIADRADCAICKMKALSNIGRIYLITNQVDSATVVYTELKTFSTKQQDKKYMSLSANNLGTCKETKGKYKEAIDLYSSSIEIKRELQDTLGVARGLKNLGNLLAITGNQEEGLSKMLEAMQLRELLKDYKGMASVARSIGNLYKRQSDYKNALLYHEKSLEISKKLGNTRSLVLPYNNIANVHYLKNDFNTALTLYQKALVICQEIQYKYGIVLTSINIANVHAEKGDYAEALNLYKESYPIASEIKNSYLISGNLQGMGWAHYKLGNINKAIDRTKKSLKIAEELNELELLKDTYKNLATMYEQANNFSAALPIWKKYQTVKDSLLNEENIRNLSNIEVGHKIAKERLTHEKEVAVKNQLVHLLEKEKSIKNRTIWALVLGLLLSTLMAFTLWRLQRQKLIVKGKEKEIVEVQLQHSKLEQEHTNSILELRSKELNNFALNLNQRITFTNQLKNKISDLKKDGSNETKEKLEYLNQFIREGQSFEEDRQILQMKLDKEQASFFDKLVIKFPELSKKEIRLATLLKIGFSSKEIATIFNIEPKSVDMQRYRLRKKMALDGKINISDFLNTV